MYTNCMIEKNSVCLIFVALAIHELFKLNFCQFVVRSLTYKTLYIINLFICKTSTYSPNKCILSAPNFLYNYLCRS